MCTEGIRMDSGAAISKAGTEILPFRRAGHNKELELISFQPAPAFCKFYSFRVYGVRPLVPPVTGFP